MNRLSLLILALLTICNFSAVGKGGDIDPAPAQAFIRAEDHSSTATTEEEELLRLADQGANRAISWIWGFISCALLYPVFMICIFIWSMIFQGSFSLWRRLFVRVYFFRLPAKQRVTSYYLIFGRYKPALADVICAVVGIALICCALFLMCFVWGWNYAFDAFWAPPRLVERSEEIIKDCSIEYGELSDDSSSVSRIIDEEMAKRVHQEEFSQPELAIIAAQSQLWSPVYFVGNLFDELFGTKISSDRLYQRWLSSQTCRSSMTGSSFFLLIVLIPILSIRYLWIFFAATFLIEAIGSLREDP